MASALQPDNPVLREGLNRLYREFFDQAERRRRWSLADDIPWGQVNRSMDPAIADVVESFCGVEMFLTVDRPETLAQLRRVLMTFAMPAVHLLADSRQRVAAIRGLGLFDEDMFVREVYQPVLTALGLTHQELRGTRTPRKSLRSNE